MLNKEFEFTIKEGLVLKNVEERNKYLQEKINHFSLYENFSNRDEILNFLKEIANMIKHDINTAKFDFKDVEKMGGFNLQERKEHMIYYYNLCIMLGTVYFNVFDKRGNRLANIDEGSVLPFSTREMMVNAYNEFLFAKEQGLKNAYGATLIFITLFERDLKLKTKMIYTEKLLRELEKKISICEVSLDEEEQNLYLDLRFKNGLDIENKSGKVYDNFRSSGELAYQLFKKYSIITTDEKFYEGLFGEKIFTLNKLIISQKFKEIVDDRFWEIVDIMFDPSKMNLRNNLAHCNLGYENYYHINITALIYGIYILTSTNMFLKQ